MRPRLKVFSSFGEQPRDSFCGHDVPMPLSEFTRILSHACDSNRAWIDDLKGETVRVSPDLYEILRMYDLIQTAERA